MRSEASTERRRVASREAQRAKRAAPTRKYTEEKRRSVIKHSAKLRAAVLAAYSEGKLACACCGEIYYGHLTLDHIGGGGAKDRRASGGNVAVFRRLAKTGFPPGFRVLCFNCNFDAHRNHGECGCQVVDHR